MKTVYFSILIFLIMIACNDNKKDSPAPPSGISKYDFTKDTSVYSNEMKRYWLVMLKKGPNQRPGQLISS